MELKKKLELAKGKWTEELLEVLWGIQCTLQSKTKETPFRLTYGIDAMIPMEIGEPSFQQLHYNETDNVENLRVELDVVDETQEREKTMAKACKQKMIKRFNTKLKQREFLEGDLVSREQGEVMKNSREGKQLLIGLNLS